LTLPLIYAKNQLATGGRRAILKLLKKKNKSKSEVAQIIDTVKEYGGIEYARDIMLDYKNKALAILEKYPESEYSNSLKAIVTYTVERKK
ncbi:MAG: polyprenyl synthetase family protein, partial [Salinivirgaceae bacterium]|nr:polyprenyl synthetase family protein [Salinivirgaceae bacterium]